MPVAVGKAAPDFTLPTDGGGKVSLKSLRGKPVVLYFYPKDDTTGCTAQACGFRDDFAKFGSKDVVVIGVSGDSAETHKLFKAYHKLPFTLLADEKAEIAKTFGVPNNVAKGKATGINEKGEKIDVFRSATIQRYTIVIDKAGKVAAADAISDAKGDSKRIAELVTKLSTK